MLERLAQSERHRPSLVRPAPTARADGSWRRRRSPSARWGSRSRSPTRQRRQTVRDRRGRARAVVVCAFGALIRAAAVSARAAQRASLAAAPRWLSRSSERSCRRRRAGCRSCGSPPAWTAGPCASPARCRSPATPAARWPRAAALGAELLLQALDAKAGARWGSSSRTRRVRRTPRRSRRIVCSIRLARQGSSESCALSHIGARVAARRRRSACTRRRSPRRGGEAGWARERDGRLLLICSPGAGARSVQPPGSPDGRRAIYAVTASPAVDRPSRLAAACRGPGGRAEVEPSPTIGIARPTPAGRSPAHRRSAAPCGSSPTPPRRQGEPTSPSALLAGRAHFGPASGDDVLDDRLQRGQLVSRGLNDGRLSEQHRRAIVGRVVHRRAS